MFDPVTKRSGINRVCISNGLKNRFGLLLRRMKVEM